MGDLPPRSGEVSGLQLTMQRRSLPGQGPAAEDRPGGRRGRRNAQAGTPGGQGRHPHPEHDGPADQCADLGGTGRPAVAIDPLLQPTGDTAEPGHRVPPLRVAEQLVGGEAEQQTDDQRTAARTAARTVARTVARSRTPTPRPAEAFG